MKIHPVILSGGSGERLWPLSRAHYPKQLLALVGEQTMLQATALRVADSDRYETPLVIANDAHRFIVAEQLRQIDRTPRSIILEPEGRNTAPAAALAAICLGAEEEPDAIMALLASDHVIQDLDGFHDAMARAAEAAARGALVTFGITPENANTGYGYIKRGAALPHPAGAYRVERFVEKPDRQTAEAYLASGDYDWNSGMFVFSARRYLEELEAYHPEILAACRQSLLGSGYDLDFLRPNQGAFADCPSISIDYAVMERTDKAVVIPCDFGWSDVGTWNALWEISERDGDGNVVLGDCLVQEVENCYLRSSDGRLIAAVGLKDMVVISTGDAVMIAPRAESAAVRDLVQALKQAERGEVEHHRQVFRPWGNFMDIDRDRHFRAKRIVIQPGGRLSLQKHKHRSEHWVVVEGTAKVTRGEEESLLPANQSTYIPKGVVHRLENPGTEPLHIIEVQVGDYLEEDDIIRLEDVYGREEEQQK